MPAFQSLFVIYRDPLLPPSNPHLGNRPTQGAVLFSLGTTGLHWMAEAPKGSRQGVFASPAWGNNGRDPWGSSSPTPCSAGIAAEASMTDGHPTSA